MLAINRQKKIIKLLKKHKSLTIQKLSQDLEISLNTVHSDINKIISTTPNIQKTYGGIIWIDSFELAIDMRYKQNSHKKQQIGELVATQLLAYNNPSVFMDSSTTTCAVIKEFVKTQKQATIITYAVDILNVIGINSEISVIGCGGTWWGKEHCFIGPKVLEEISNYKTHIAILGASGLVQDIGILNGNVETNSIKQMMNETSAETWIVCEDIKFDQNSLVYCIDFTNITKIFTNKEPSISWQKFLAEQNIEILY